MATKSPSSKAVDAVIQGDVKSFLKSEGFKKSGRTFHRQKGEMLQVVNSQTTWLNTPDEAQFTINLNVVLPFYHEKWTGQQVPKNPGSAAAICSRRLGHILPREDGVRTGSPIKGLVKRKNTSPIEKHICFSFTLSLLPALVLRC